MEEAWRCRSDGGVASFASFVIIGVADDGVVGDGVGGGGGVRSVGGSRVEKAKRGVTKGGQARRGRGDDGEKRAMGCWGWRQGVGVDGSREGASVPPTTIFSNNSVPCANEILDYPLLMSACRC